MVVVRVVARLDGPCLREMNIGERSIEYEGKTMQFDAVYAGLSDEAFFAAACEPVLECDRGTFLCSGGACAEVSRAVASFADAFETASAVDVREDRVYDVFADGELAVDSKTKKFRPAAEAAARDERCRCGGAPDAHRLVFLARPAKGALCVAALASGDDTKTQQGLAALLNVLASKEPADRRPYQDSKLTKLLDGGWLDSFVVFCVFVGRETATADAAARLKYASRLRRLSGAGPAAADPMFESLKSRAMRTKHEAEIDRLKREQRDAQLTSDAELAKALRESEVIAKRAADERESIDREVAAKLRSDEARAAEDAKRELLEADRKLAADLARADVK